MTTESRIDKVLEQLFSNPGFPSEPSGLYAPLGYMIEIGGKRLRPRLALTTYSLYKDSFTEEILQPAMGLEIYHNFTLIHDDIMDNSPLRRGVPTVWKKWGMDAGILSGDVMSIESFRRMTMAPQRVLPLVMDLFCNTAAGVCEGQQYDMEFERMDRVSMESYIEMIGLKTGALIACAAKLGALIAGASESDCDNLYEYGYNLGLAFQVADDYLDAYGDEKVFGKPIGGDIVNNKKSWLTVRAFEKASQAQAEALEKALQMPVGTDEEKGAKIAAVMNLYSELGVDEDAKYEILRLNSKAMEFASSVCSGVRLETLRRFAEKLVGRSK